MKSIAELKAEEARIRALLDAGAEAELRAIPGVIHVSVGLKQINGTATDEFSIRVYVQKKKPSDAIPPAERIPKSIGGIRTDVNEVPVTKPFDDTARYRPITGGIQITIAAPGQGTLGCFATDNTDGEEVLLTNHHVVNGLTSVGVFQPDDTLASDLIAITKRVALTGTIDAAIAQISTGEVTTRDEINGLFLGGSNKIAGVADPVSGMRVHKVGRTTGFTSGKIVDADGATDVDHGSPLGVKHFTKVIFAQSTKISGCCCCTCEVADTSKKFAAPGDSGAIVVSDKRMAIGMIMSGDESEGMGYACRMTEIESGLDITINRTVVIATPPTPPGPGGGTPIPFGGGVADPFSTAPGPADPEEETVWSMMQRRLEQTPFGREISVQVRYHLPECIDLVNHHRAVMVAWQRVEGPSFLAQWMNGIRNPSTAVPKEINGVTMNTALLRMAAVLKEHGSLSLQQAIDNYGIDVMALLDESATVDELMENIGKPVSV